MSNWNASEITKKNYISAYPKTPTESFRFDVINIGGDATVTLQHDPLYDGPIKEKFKRRSKEWLGTGKKS